MLINPNLISEKDLSSDFTGVEERSWKHWRYMLPDGLIDGETYTVSCKLKQGENGSGYATILTANVGINANNALYAKKVPVNDFKASFVYDSSKMNCIGIFVDEDGKTKYKTAERSELKLEKGKEKTPYIPNGRDVDPLKSTDFIGGGYVQRGISNLVTTLSNLLMGRRLQRDN